MSIDTERELIQRKIATIAARYHYERPTGEVHGRRFPKNLTLMALSFLLEGKHLLFGDPGWGKTTAAKVIATVFTGVPYDLYDKVEMRGNPQKYEEKTIARPDYGALSGGAEKVVWLGAVGTPVLIVDELNRFSPEMQDVLLQGLDTGSWQYLNDHHHQPIPAFLTANFRAENTSSFIPPLLDRMSVMTEERYAGATADYHAALAARRAELCDEDLAAGAIAVLHRDGIHAFGAHLQEHTLPGVEALDPSRRAAVAGAIRALPCTWVDEETGAGHNDPLLFFYALVAEINHSEMYGCKRSADPISDETHDRAHVGSLVHTSLSPRAQMAALDYARGLAWLLGDDFVDVDHLKAVLPHVLAHRLEFSAEFRNEQAQSLRDDCEELYLSAQLVERAHEHYREVAGELKNLLAALQQARGDAERLAAFDADDYDHPLAKELIAEARRERDLEAWQPAPPDTPV